MEIQSLDPEFARMLLELCDELPVPDPMALRITACAYPCDKLVAPLLDSLGLPLVYLLSYRRFCRSLTARFKRYSGSRLAFEIEDCFGMWMAKGLDFEVMQKIAVESWRLLKEKCEETREASLRQT